MKKSFFVLIILALFIGGVFASDYNYSKTILVSMDFNLIIDSNAGTVTIQTPAQTNSYSTAISRSQVMSLNKDYNITQNDCPNFSQLVDPLKSLLQNSGLSDLNTIIKYLKDNNVNNQDCKSVIEEKLNNFEGIVGSNRVLTQSFLTDQLIPNINKVNDINNNLKLCEANLVVTQGNVGLAIERASLSDQNRFICETNLNNSQSAQDDVVAITMVVLVLSICLNFYFIAKEQGLLKRKAKS